MTKTGEKDMKVKEVASGRFWYVFRENSKNHSGLEYLLKSGEWSEYCDTGTTGHFATEQEAMSAMNAAMPVIESVVDIVKRRIESALTRESYEETNGSMGDVLMWECARVELEDLLREILN